MFALFKATWEKNGKKITFLAVDHIQDHPQELRSELAIIKNEIEKSKADALMLERTSQGPIPPESALASQAACNKDGTFQCGESEWSTIVAAENKIVNFGAEPIPPVFYQALTKQISRQDMLAFASTRAVLTMKREEYLLRNGLNILIFMRAARFISR